MKREPMTDQEIALKCVTCSQGKWVGTVHECKRKTCKYRTAFTSRVFKDK